MTTPTAEEVRQALLEFANWKFPSAKDLGNGAVQSEFVSYKKAARHAADLLQSLHDAKERAEKDAERWQQAGKNWHTFADLLDDTYRGGENMLQWTDRISAAIDNAREGGRG